MTYKTRGTFARAARAMAQFPVPPAYAGYYAPTPGVPNASAGVAQPAQYAQPQPQPQAFQPVQYVQPQQPMVHPPQPHPAYHPTPPQQAQTPVYAAPIVASGGQAVTTDDRWAVLWSALKIYYCVDASFAFCLALGGLVVSLATVGGKDPACTAPFLAISAIIFVTRLVDFAHGVSSVCCCCPSTPPPAAHGPRKDNMGHSIRFNIFVCVSQMVLSILQIGLGVVGVLGGFGTCEGAGPVLAVVFGAMLLMNAAEEVYIWGWAYVLHNQQDQIPLPNWVDACIPDCIWQYARNSSR